jgi:hypothetical protein
VKIPREILFEIEGKGRERRSRREGTKYLVT